MSNKGRYVQIIKGGNHNNVKYKKGEIWQIIDDSIVCPDIINNIVEVTTISLFQSRKEAILLSKDYSPDNVQPNEISIQLW